MFLLSFLREIANVRYPRVLENINNINIMLMGRHQHELISIPGKTEPSVTLYRLNSSLLWTSEPGHVAYSQVVGGSESDVTALEPEFLS